MKRTIITLSQKEMPQHLNSSTLYKGNYIAGNTQITVYGSELGIFYASIASDDLPEILNNIKKQLIPYPQELITKAPLIITGTPFQNKVWKALVTIQYGNTASYSELAQHIGQPKAYRAVARAVGQNNIAYFIPCHRIIGKNGTLVGYKWGMNHKSNLLQTEIAQQVGLA